MNSQSDLRGKAKYPSDPDIIPGTPIGRPRNVKLIGIALVLSSITVITACALSEASPQSNWHPATHDLDAMDPDYPPEMRELSFTSEGSKLNGLMYVADGLGPHPTVVLLHGYAGNERNLDLAQAMRRDGKNVLYFNYRGTWGSGGVFSISNALKDVANALELLRDCLLYTSPSPRDQRGSRMPSSA